jgi:hypothetical protein
MVYVDNDQRRNDTDNDYNSNDADNSDAIDDDIDDEDVWRKIIRNDPSITHLTVNHDFEGYIPPADDWEGLGRAVGNNTNLTSISLDNDPNHEIPERLLEFLPGFASNRSIQKFSISGWNLSESTTFHNLTKFFSCNENLEKLEVENCFNLPALQFLLKKFNHLKEFKLFNDFAFSENVDVIMTALSLHAELRKLDLCFVSVSIEGGGFAAINKLSDLTEIYLKYCLLDDEGMTMFADFLACNGMLRVLLINDLDITEVGWVAIFAALQRSKCRLKELHLTCSIETEAAAFSLSSALLIQNKTLKCLSLDFAELGLVSTASWNAVFHFLRSPESTLEDFELYASCDNEGIAALTNALANNGKLRHVKLSLNENITDVGWVSFAAVLRNPNSALETLDLFDSYIEDRAVLSFAEALAGNNILRELILDSSIINIPAFTRILCNNSSIMSTYQSNHTLERLSNEDVEGDQADVLVQLLLLNRYNNVTQAARLKIIKMHFNGREIKMQPFTEMELSLRPYAIAWMGRDNSLYQFLRAMPSLLRKGDGKKRKHIA